MERLVDARGLLCPLAAGPRARRRWPRWPPATTLVVLATDPEAPIDLAALAADAALPFDQEQVGGEWRLGPAQNL